MTDKQRPGASRPRFTPSKGTALTRPPDPEIRVGMTTAGRETLDAIEDELAASPRRGKPRKLPSRDSGPEIVVAQVPAGRDTLAAITEELLSEARAPLDTLPYGDRLANAPGAVTPSKPPRPRSDPARAPKARRSATPAPAVEGTQIFEVLTFVLRHAEASSLKSEENRRRFVETRLLSRLPGRSMQRVSRIDLTPWTEKDTLVLRVWLRVDPAG